MAIITFIMGSGWFASVALLIGGVLAELISAVGKYKSFKWNTIGYAAFAVLTNLGVYWIILLARDFYLNFSVKSGMDAGMMNMLMNHISGPILLLTCTLAAICAVGGMFLGKAMLKKHFEKAGVV
jgi:energy-coupling factor transport system substrate-specific component